MCDKTSLFFIDIYTSEPWINKLSIDACGIYLVEIQLFENLESEGFIFFVFIWKLSLKLSKSSP